MSAIKQLSENQTKKVVDLISQLFKSLSSELSEEEKVKFDKAMSRFYDLLESKISEAFELILEENEAEDMLAFQQKYAKKQRQVEVVLEGLMASAQDQFTEILEKEMA